MFLNIITPCSRPQNLWTISESINIPRDNYRWIVVFDADTLPNADLIPDNCEAYIHQDAASIAGHAQRNFALDLINRGHVYSNDDDTLIHPELWTSINDIDDDFISFIQLNKDSTIRLMGNSITYSFIDSHNFIVKHEIISDSRFVVSDYGADGLFAIECYEKAVTKLFIGKALSVYNALRD
jgi:hypothetical protein